MKKDRETIPYVCLYDDYLEMWALFTNEEKGRLTDAMLRYSRYGELPELEGNERFVWPMIRSKIDRDQNAYRERCEKNRRNGKKGGRPPKKTAVATETDWFSEEPK